MIDVSVIRNGSVPFEQTQAMIRKSWKRNLKRQSDYTAENLNMKIKNGWLFIVQMLCCLVNFCVYVKLACYKMRCTQTHF